MPLQTTWNPCCTTASWIASPLKPTSTSASPRNLRLQKKTVRRQTLDAPAPAPALASQKPVRPSPPAQVPLSLRLSVAKSPLPLPEQIRYSPRDNQTALTAPQE